MKENFDRVGRLALAPAASGEAALIQVCADAGDPATDEREQRALTEAAAMYPDARRRLLTLTRDGAPVSAPPDVVVQPAYEWFLTEPDAE